MAQGIATLPTLPCILAKIQGGLVPQQYSTGGRSILGRISKRGSKYLRTLLIQAAKVLLMRPHNWGRYSFGPWLNSASPLRQVCVRAAKPWRNATE